MENAIAKWVVDTVSPFTAADQRIVQDLMLSINSMVRLLNRHDVRHTILADPRKLLDCVDRFIYRTR